MSRYCYIGFFKDMILGRKLNKAEEKSSCRNYLRYCMINGASYMCLGETVLILFAVQLKVSDVVIAVLGSLIYFGFLLLPLGKVMTARVGAAKSQADFWIMRNISALFVALAAPVSLYMSHALAICMLIIGAFLFYGFRAAGVVMAQPLLGEICQAEKLGGFFSRSISYFYISGLAALLLITLCLKIDSGVWMLFAVILAGTMLGFASSTFIRKIHETGEIREYAKKPLLPEIKFLLNSPVIKRQMLAGMFSNMAIIFLVPISTLTLKRGYGVSDSQALLYSLVQFGSSIAGAWVLSKISDRLGARKLIIAGFYGNYVIALLWLIMPMNFNWFLAVIPFVFCISGSVICSTAMTHYFLNTVPKKRQVSASMVISVATGVFSGLAGMMISSGFLKLASFCNQTENPLVTYKYYFLFVLLVLPFMGIFIHRLAKEKRFRQRTK